MVDDVAAKTPPVPVALHVTVWPASARGFPLASSSFAVIVTAAPATGVRVAAVTTYPAGVCTRVISPEQLSAAAPAGAVAMTRTHHARPRVDKERSRRGSTGTTRNAVPQSSGGFP